MRIGIISSFFPPLHKLGAAFVAMNLAELMAELNNEVVVFCPSDVRATPPQKRKSNGFSVIEIPIDYHKKLPSIQFFLALNDCLKRCSREKQFDLFVINGLFIFSYLQALSKSPRALIIHHSVIDNMRTSRRYVRDLFSLSSETCLINILLEIFNLKISNAVISISAFTKASVIKYYNYSKDIFIIRPRDSNNIQFEERPPCLDQKSGSIQRLLFVGGIDDPRKGLDFLLQAFQKTSSSINATLVIVGRGDVEKLKRRLKSQESEKRIEIMGFVSKEELASIYQLVDIVVIPSRLEGYCLPIVESMAAGKAIIATNTGAIPELVVHGVNGFLVKYGDIEDLASKIEILLNDHSLRMRFEKNNLAQAAKLFDRSLTKREVKEFLDGMSALRFDSRKQ